MDIYMTVMNIFTHIHFLVLCSVIINGHLNHISLQIPTIQPSTLICVYGYIIFCFHGNGAISHHRDNFTSLYILNIRIHIQIRKLSFLVLHAHKMLHSNHTTTLGHADTLANIWPKDWLRSELSSSNKLKHFPFHLTASTKKHVTNRLQS